MKTETKTAKPAQALNRRAFLQSVIAAAPGAAALVGCERRLTAESGARARSRSANAVQPWTEATGPTREVRLVAAAGEVEVAPGRRYRTWLYNGAYPGPEIRLREGERLRVTLENRLSEGTTIHWHGIPVPNPMDGVPDVTQKPAPPGESFVYDFVAGPAGSYLYHSHVGLQIDRGLIGPVIVEEAQPPLPYDREYVVVLDDFLSGAPRMLESSGPAGRGRGGGMMGGMMGGTAVPPYDGLLVNGRLPEAAPTFPVRRGERVRFRFLNPSGATAYRVALAGHRLTITHADGRPVRPVEVDSFFVGMGERYDAIVEARNPGAWALMAAPLEVQAPPARAILRYKDAAATRLPAEAVPEGLRGGRLLSLDDLVSPEAAGSDRGAPDRTFDLVLSGGMMSSAWTINGQAYPNADPLEIHKGERVRVRMTNQSMMLHPMHLHGHFFRVGDALKDTVIVAPHMGRVTFDFAADNPGDWFFHCHNIYHMESGMARVIRYV